ncbi:translation machinery-associated protein 16-like isoform X2 [Zootermopsis nevadensis]|uniref:translation machinery-associated protein 16-like isoform X1 n=1 Tax=Zootermopsis nevadensis TaxID=136037 RepID=UPI000B8E2D40|nr:translation machinery-associated protein 16-like isoform X1 [Zootermopsis nevadensis]XP_021924248.1 translation machinery-associated protein 16-like isoform X2 [Zootermopsis nevadensis]
MPKSIKKELSKKILHPKSRKAVKLTKQTKKITTREKTKLMHHMKQNLIGEKFLWFRDHLVPDITKYTPELILIIIELYLGRFKEELEQISLKHSIGNRKNRQHASREDIIRLTLLREEEEFATCGLEIPDVTIPKQLEMLRNWDGELRLLQNFKLRRFSRKSLRDLVTCPKLNEEELVIDDNVAVKSALSVKAPIVQNKESNPQNVVKSDVNETPVILESETRELTVADSMDIDSK